VTAAPAGYEADHRPITTALFAAALGFLGLFSALPLFLGPVLGVTGVALAAFLRRRPSARTGDRALVPALAVLVLLLLASPSSTATALFGGLGSLAFLLWLADDPWGAPGGGRRAVTVLAFAGLSFGLAWGIDLAFVGATGNVGAAGLLAVVALLVLAVVLLWGAERPAPETA
jgi:hypothetical protein